MADALAYRLFRLDALTGAIEEVVEFAAWSDDEAISRALDQAGVFRLELWRDGYRLAAISGRDGPSELTIARHD